MLFGLSLAVFLLPAGLLMAPASSRRPFAVALAFAALPFAWMAMGDEPRSLDVTHAFPAFEGNLVRSKAFLIETVHSTNPVWAVLGVIWCLAWAAFGWLRRPSGTAPGADALSLGWVWAPFILGVAGGGLILAWQKLAAPAALALPLARVALPPAELALWPAAIAAAVAVGRSSTRIPHLILRLPLWIALARAPFVGFAWLATDHHWGTYFDVHSIEFVADPLRRRPLELPTGSSEQFGWLILGPQLLVLPALTWLSASGVAFMVFMIRRHQATQSGSIG